MFSGDLSNQPEDSQGRVMGFLLCKYVELQLAVAAEIRNEDDGEEASSMDCEEG